MLMKAKPILQSFVPKRQAHVIANVLRSEEGEGMAEILEGLKRTLETMPKTYDQDGKGDDAVVHLHYFTGGCDWWITEKDSDPDGEGQQQAFGLADLGYGPELGYISLVELCAHPRVELDLFWTPKTVGEIKRAKGG